MDEQNDRMTAFKIAKRTLGRLEEQAAGYTALTIPAHLVNDLDQTRIKVKEMAEQLKIDPSSLRCTVQHNLPPSSTKFVGREKELAQIRGLLHPGSKEIRIAISGIGGIGKTTLALEAARWYIDPTSDYAFEETFDVIVWVSAKQKNLSFDESLPHGDPREFLKSVLSTISVQLNQEEIRRMLVIDDQRDPIYGALGKIRALLVVDNLEDVSDSSYKEVIEFINGLPATTRIILTSRTRVKNAHFTIELEGLPQDKADILIEQECKRKKVLLNEEERRKVYQITGGIPLAIVFSIGLIKDKGDTDYALEKLVDPQGEYVEFIFGKTLETIRGKPAFQTLQALAVFPKDASREALQFVTSFSAAQLWDSLITLIDFSVINERYFQKDSTFPISERFSLHPLTRTLVNNMTAGIEYQSRLRDWYKDFLRQNGGYRKVQKRRLAHLETSFQTQGFGNLDLEIENILGLLEEMRKDPIATEDVIYFVRRLSDYLYFKNRWPDRIYWCAGAYQLLANRNRINKKQRYLAGWLARDVGWTHYQSAQWGLAAEWAERAWEMLAESEIGDTPEIHDTGKDESGEMEFSWLYTVVHGLKAHVAMQDQDYATAEMLFGKALALQLRLYETAIDEEERGRRAEQVAIYYSDLANLKHRSGDYTAARQFYQYLLKEPWAANVGRCAEAELSLVDIALVMGLPDQQAITQAMNMVLSTQRKFKEESEIEQNHIRERNLKRCTRLQEDLEELAQLQQNQ